MKFASVIILSFPFLILLPALAEEQAAVQVAKLESRLGKDVVVSSRKRQNGGSFISIQIFSKADEILEQLAMQPEDTRKLVEEIILADDDLSRRGIERLKRLPKLERLTFEGTWREDWNYIFVDLPNLNRLWMQRTGITQHTLKEFSTLEKIEVLMIDGNDLPAGSLEVLHKLINLRQLSVSSKSLTDDDFHFLPKTKGLHAIHLTGTSVTDKIVDLLADCKSLEIVDLSGTDVSPAAIMKLKLQLPNAIISSR